MATQERITAAKAYVDALSTGDKQAAAAASKHLADDIVVTVGQREFAGHDEALARITGVWPQTPVYRKTTWPAPQDSGDHVTVAARMAAVGAGPTEVHLKFWFNDADQISKVEQENVIGQPLVESNEFPDFATQRVNDALANDTPMAVSYVDDGGPPTSVPARQRPGVQRDAIEHMGAERDDGYRSLRGEEPPRFAPVPRQRQPTST